jgi:hypothetical protein
VVQESLTNISRPRAPARFNHLGALATGAVSAVTTVAVFNADKVLARHHGLIGMRVSESHTGNQHRCPGQGHAHRGRTAMQQPTETQTEALTETDTSEPAQQGYCCFSMQLHRFPCPSGSPQSYRL